VKWLRIVTSRIFQHLFWVYSDGIAPEHSSVFEVIPIDLLHGVLLFGAGTERLL
jgi:hypothetical protein